jgi:hypothetical protein
MIKQGASIDLDHLRRLAKRKKYLSVVIALGLVSPAISLGFLFWERNILVTAFSDRSASEPGCLAITSKIRTSQMSLVSC